MSVSRRKLLWIGSGAVCAHALGCGLDAMPSLPSTIAAGRAADLAVGTLQAVGSDPVAIGRDSGGIYALSLICTHAGCNIAVNGSVSAGGVQCFCHGSVFDGQGNVLRGPANSPLPHLLVTEDASGNLTIHGDQPTPESTRLPG